MISVGKKVQPIDYFYLVLIAESAMQGVVQESAIKVDAGSIAVI